MTSTNMDTSSSVVLPDGIIELILSRCPLESVVRFKVVSKSWYSIISSCRFSRIHRIQRSRLLEDQNTFFLWKERQWGRRIYDYGLNLIRLELDDETKCESVILGYPAFSGGYFEPLCSCNGLILLLSQNMKFVLWNPLIRKHIIIPNPKTHHKVSTYWVKQSFHLYHDSITDDYKIVFHYEPRCYTVYSCRNGSWGEIRDFPLLDWKECVYGIDGSCLYMRCSNTEIIYFDVRDEKLHKFPLPKGVEGLAKVKLEALAGRLCLYGYNDNLNQRLHLWVMEENGSFDKSWRKLISTEEAEYWLCFLKPVYLTNKDEVFLRGRVCDDSTYNPNAPLIYNPHGNRTFKRIDDHYSSFKFFIPYLENLDMPHYSPINGESVQKHVF